MGDFFVPHLGDFSTNEKLFYCDTLSQVGTTSSVSQMRSNEKLFYFDSFPPNEDFAKFCVFCGTGTQKIKNAHYKVTTKCGYKLVSFL